MSGLVVSDIAIDDLLGDLGYGSDAARAESRRALEEARLTNGRKQRIALSKIDAVRAVLASRLFVACARASCRTTGVGSGRRVVDAGRPADCEVCGGSANQSAIERAVAVLAERGLRRVVVVGGSPVTHDELRAVVGDALEMRLVTGTDRRTGADAKADLIWADLIVVWGSTQLDHKVSQLYTTARSGRVVTCARRGLAALADTMITAAASR